MSLISTLNYLNETRKSNLIKGKKERRIKYNTAYNKCVRPFIEGKLPGRYIPNPIYVDFAFNPTGCTSYSVDCNTGREAKEEERRRYDEKVKEIRKEERRTNKLNAINCMMEEGFRYTFD